jgi:hypothetical protein
MFCLQLQFSPRVELQRIAGDELMLPTGVDGMDEIVRGYDVWVTFDVRELDYDSMKAKLDALSTVLPEDIGGVVDRNKFTLLKIRAIDPDIANQIVSEKGQASLKLMNEVKQDLIGIMAGVQPAYVENDPSAPFKLETLQRMVAGNPKVVQQLASDPQAQEMIKKYVANLEMSVKQQRNKVVGKLGVDPGEAQLPAAAQGQP